MTHTQAAAQRCADLANAINGSSSPPFSPMDFTDDHSLGSDNEAFRREVEAKDAMIREVLALLTQVAGDTPKGRDLLRQAKDKLRANLLPDPQPTLLEEFKRDKPSLEATPDAWEGIEVALDWIAKREKGA